MDEIRKTTEAQRRANEKSNKKNTVMCNLRINKNTDKDIYEWLLTLGNKQGTIKKIIRKHIEQ